MDGLRDPTGEHIHTQCTKDKRAQHYKAREGRQQTNKSVKCNARRVCDAVSSVPWMGRGRGRKPANNTQHKTGFHLVTDQVQILSHSHDTWTINEEGLTAPGCPGEL